MENIFSDKNTKINIKRLLIIYDLSSQPFSIGDILLFQEVSLILKETNKVNIMDFAFIYDVEKPYNGDPSFKLINRNNLIYNLNSLIPVALLNPYINSFHIFSSRSELLNFVEQNESNLIIWPSISDIMSERYMYYKVFNNIIPNFLSKNNYIPPLLCSQHLINWAYSFYKINAYSSIPVTINIRNNPNHGNHRNSEINTWLSFIKMCENKFQVKFIIICSRAEIDTRFHKLSNALIAKEYDTRVDQDIALINAAAFHMGTSSGPGTVPFFSNKPFVITNSDIDINLYEGVQKKGDFIVFKHFKDCQRLTCKKETTEFLFFEFVRMFALINQEEWISGKIFSNFTTSKDIEWLN